MKIFPAIDLMGGEAVRLTQGDFNTKEVFSSDPEKIMGRFKREGAVNLHIVDLDGARSGAPLNFKIIGKLAADKDFFIEVGGGIRDLKRIEDYLALGISRVILGTAAVKDFGFTERAVKIFGAKIAVGIDAKDGFAAVSGWEEKSGILAFDFAKRCFEAGVKTVIYTDISKDGAMRGTNMEAFRRLAEIKGLDIIASGGITYLEEIEELKKLKISGAILGKALYKGLIKLSDAVALAGEQ